MCFRQNVSYAYGAANECGFLDERFPWLWFLAADLVEREQQVVFVGQLRGELNLHFIVELRGPGGWGH